MPTMRATVVAGVIADKLVSLTSVMTKVKKFNEDTGVPYEKEERKNGISMCGKFIETDYKDVQSVFNWGIHGLECFSPGELGDGVDYRNYVIGLGVNSVSFDADRPCRGIDSDRSEELIDKATTILRGLGYTGEVGLVLILYGS